MSRVAKEPSDVVGSVGTHSSCSSSSRTEREGEQERVGEASRDGGRDGSACRRSTYDVEMSVLHFFRYVSVEGMDGKHTFDYEY